MMIYQTLTAATVKPALVVPIPVVNTPRRANLAAYLIVIKMQH